MVLPRTEQQSVDAFYKLHGWRFAFKAVTHGWKALWATAPPKESHRPKYSVGYILAHVPLDITLDQAFVKVNLYFEHKYYWWHVFEGSQLPMRKRHTERVRLAGNGRRVIDGWKQRINQKEFGKALVDPQVDGDSLSNSQDDSAPLLKRSRGSDTNSSETKVTVHSKSQKTAVVEGSWVEA